MHDSLNSILLCELGEAVLFHCCTITKNVCSDITSIHIVLNESKPEVHYFSDRMLFWTHKCLCLNVCVFSYNHYQFDTLLWCQLWQHLLCKTACNLLEWSDSISLVSLHVYWLLINIMLVVKSSILTDSNESSLSEYCIHR